jgi:hypothetical protein
MLSSPSRPSSTTGSPLYALSHSMFTVIWSMETRHDRVGLAPDEDPGDIRQGAEVAVSIAHGGGDDARRVVGLPRGAIADGMTGCHDFEVHDAGLPDERRPNGDGVADLR